MTRTAVPILIALFMVGCAKTDPNAPSAELFLQVIQATPAAATQRLCQEVNTRLIELPREYRKYETNDSSFAKFKVLAKLGYVSIDKTKIAHSFGGTVDGYSVALTEKGREAFAHEYDSKRCIVEWKAQQVKDFTPPSDVAGLNISRVNVNGQQTYTGWATDAELRGLFKMRDLPAEAEQTVILVLKNTGWQVLESAQ
ncbi:hypothetical protein DESA109040_12075 [Deinococcus saxicola]|uniref:hypothetical protein n=1 Tax=Deinococcus saxicola TaxID=249406 RepID=UPI0039F029E7